MLKCVKMDSMVSTSISPIFEGFYVIFWLYYIKNIPYNEIITYLEVFMKIVVDSNYCVVSIEYDEKTTDSNKITIDIKNEVSLTEDE